MSWNYTDWEDDNQDRAHSNYVYTQWQEFLSTLDKFELTCSDTQRLLAKLGLDRTDPLLAKYLVDERAARDKHHKASQQLLSQIDYEDVLTSDYYITKEEIHHQIARSKAAETAHSQNEFKVASPQEAEAKPSQLSFFEIGLLEDPVKPSTQTTEKKDPTQV